MHTRVVALVDGRGRDWVRGIEDPVHELCEMPLNHLGMVVRRHDIRLGPPPAEWMDETRAVLTHFGFTESAPDWLWPWLEEQGKRPGLRFLHLGSFGPLIRDAEGRADATRLARWLSRFGLGFDLNHIDGPLGIDVNYRSRALCAMENDGRGRGAHHGPWSENARNRPWVETKHPADPGRTRTPVVTGPWGGIALDPWLCEYGSDRGDRRWRVDLFAFFREALALDGVPAPHPSVLNGRRMFFCHVDGDGFPSISTVIHGALCGQVFLERIADRYRIPLSVSIIVAELTDDYAVAEPTARMLLARKLLMRENVEAGTHTVLHPFFWGAIPEDLVGNRVRGFDSIANYVPSPRAEVGESIRFVDERLLRDGKRCRIILWPGDACPPEEAILEGDARDNVNINGGLFRWDATVDSVGYVSPWGRIIGDAVQVYAGAPNENVFPGFFTTMPSAFRHVHETMARTGRGRILKPANVYIHFYSVERPARLRALQHLLERWTTREETAPVFASRYAAAVKSAMTTARVLRAPNGFAFHGFGACPTARIDDETRRVNWDQSTGIHGARRIDGALYLHLSGATARVVLSETAPDRPHVEQADHELTDPRLTDHGVRFVTQALFPRRIVLAGFGADGEAVVQIDGRPEMRRADTDGRLTLTFDGDEPVTVEVWIP